MLIPTDFSNPIAFAFEAVGGIGAAAKVCDRSKRLAKSPSNPQH
jgi:hypothetical protein